VHPTIRRKVTSGADASHVRMPRQRVVGCAATSNVS
jgi:hypothetical protein